MERRRFLATTGIVLLGGCTFADSEETPTVTPVGPPENGTETPTETPGTRDDPALTAEELRERRVVDFETVRATSRRRSGSGGFPASGTRRARGFETAMGRSISPRPGTTNSLSPYPR
ncbi:hypothetical protein BRC63_07105 [Halobacteriales archaeon QH_10_70_21]|nr:MAG: hypothetical protein BRC63_07105 [Halobacteriales archaeon QH_10_70_21]